MLAVIARLKVAEGRESDLEVLMLELAGQVRANEPGNKLYKLAKDSQGQYLVLELYEDQSALKAHGASAHFKEAGPKFAGIMTGTPEIQYLEVIDD